MRNKFVALLAACALTFTASAQVAVQSLYTFPTSVTNGSAPSGKLLLASDGFLYGTTRTGGLYTDSWGATCGTLFKVNPTNGTFTSLLSFGYTNGARPAGDLIQSSGVLYGTTQQGGAYGEGTLFASTTGGSLVTPWSFNFAPSLGFINGGYPRSGVVLGSNGYLFGVTPSGGTYASGTIYTSSTSGNFSTVYNFNAGGLVPLEDRADPAGLLIQSTTSNLYGLTPSGGSNNVGFIYTLSLTGAYTNLASFIPTNTGSYPSGQLLQTSDGNLYGVALAGGSNGFGGIFKVSTNTFALTALAAFNNTNGAYPVAGLVQSTNDGFMYGVSKIFSTNGSIFQVSTNAGAITNVALFAGTNGANPDGALIYDPATTNFYGVASAGGNGNGVIYQIVPAPVLVSTNATQTSTTGLQITNTAVVQGMPALSFAWWHNHTNLIVNGPQISGALTSSLVFSNVASSNLGTYTLVVTNTYGLISNNVALDQ